MAERILITGGAGFIGCHVAEALLARGDEVRVLDGMVEQVHAGQPRNPVLRDCDVQIANVCDPDAVARALYGVDAVVHLAAEVGVGQSMYEIERYVGANDLGTAVLLEGLSRDPVRRLVVASSMSIYGEGLYRDADDTPVEHAARGNGAGWDPTDTRGRPLVPVPTPEWKRASLASVYAITKYVQERLALTVAPAYGIEATALRLFNVYGPGQALSNPYTGVLAIFAARLLNGARPQVFEDGEQQRDFVHVKDVADGFLLALDHEAAPGGVFNIGSGEPVSINEVARRIAVAMNRPHLAPEILHKARTGDIRHCFANIHLARKQLGYAPRRTMQDTLPELADWVGRQQAVDRVAQARLELESRGLVA